MFQFQVYMQIAPNKFEWRSVHPTGGKPYEYTTHDEAYRQMETCYPNEILGKTVRVIEV